MRLKTVKGVLEVTKVEGIVEAHVKLNGRTRRLIEIAKDDTQNVHGLLFTINEGCGQVGFGLSTEDKLLVGNLSKEAVSSILDSLATENYADISTFVYQRKSVNPLNVTYDEGSSRPYYLESFLATSGLNVNNQFGCCTPPAPVIEDEGYCPELDDLRAEVFEKTKEYPISKLADMCEAELLEILEGLESQF